MSGQKRRRLSIGSWRELMRRFDASGKTVTAFCAAEGLGASSFHRWRARLRAADGESSNASAVPTQPRPRSQPVAPGFIDLGSLAGPSRNADTGLELRLELGGGLVLQLLRR